jgi:hypothetical protein
MSASSGVCLTGHAALRFADQPAENGNLVGMIAALTENDPVLRVKKPPATP